MKISGKTVKKLALVAVVAALFVVFFQQGWHQQLTFENLKARQGERR